MEEIDSNLSSSPNSESEWELLPDQKPESKVSNRHWNKLRNIFNASCKLSRYNAEEVHDVSALIRSLQKIPTNRAYQLKKNLNISSLQQAFDNHKTEELFYRTIEKGDPNEIFIITKIIDADPYKFLRPVSHPDSIFNRKNRLGYTPLYIACRNGNLEYVEFFLKNEANWLILSENESCSLFMKLIRFVGERKVHKLL